MKMHIRECNPKEMNCENHPKKQATVVFYERAQKGFNENTLFGLCHACIEKAFGISEVVTREGFGLTKKES